MTIEQLYTERCNRPKENNHPDIFEHLPVLRKYAEQVTTIAEIGVRTGNSTTAFLAGLQKHGGHLYSFDIAKQQFFPPCVARVGWMYFMEDTTKPECIVPKVELFFIDGCHRYDAVKADLRHAALATRFLIMHDTNEERDANFGDGVVRAMEEFMDDHREWRIVERLRNNNGLTVMKRKTS